MDSSPLPRGTGSPPRVSDVAELTFEEAMILSALISRSVRWSAAVDLVLEPSFRERLASAPEPVRDTTVTFVRDGQEPGEALDNALAI